MKRVTADREARRGPSVVMAHAFVTGAVSSDSERDISVGGVSAVPPSVFDGADYVALGHLHRAQAVTERVRYSGSPYAMSFGEHAQTKGSWLVEVDESGLVSTELVAAPVDRPLRVLRGDLDDLLADPALVGAERAYCQVTLTDPVRPLGAMDRLRQRFPHTLVLGFEPRGGAVSISSYAAALGRRSDDLDVCCDFLAHVRGGYPASAQERGLFAEAVEASRVERAARLDELGAMLPGSATSCSQPGRGLREAAPARGDGVRAVRGHGHGRLRRGRRQRAVPHPRADGGRQDQPARRRVLRPVCGGARRAAGRPRAAERPRGARCCSGGAAGVRGGRTAVPGDEVAGVPAAEEARRRVHQGARVGGPRGAHGRPVARGHLAGRRGGRHRHRGPRDGARPVQQGGAASPGRVRGVPAGDGGRAANAAGEALRYLDLRRRRDLAGRSAARAGGRPGRGGAAARDRPGAGRGRPGRGSRRGAGRRRRLGFGPAGVAARAGRRRAGAARAARGDVPGGVRRRGEPGGGRPGRRGARDGAGRPAAPWARRPEDHGGVRGGPRTVVHAERHGGPSDARGGGLGRPAGPGPRAVPGGGRSGSGRRGPGAACSVRGIGLDDDDGGGMARDPR